MGFRQVRPPDTTLSDDRVAIHFASEVEDLRMQALAIVQVANEDDDSEDAPSRVDADFSYGDCFT